MRAKLGLTGGALLLAATVVVEGECHEVVSAETDRPRILLEHFTSQGCSSCPPADRLLGRIGDEGEALPLAFHVDYWNRLGWRDPFSRKAWSERQRRYARALGAKSVYTPQVVIDGRRHVVGSDEEALRGALGGRPATRPATLRLAVLEVCESELKVRVQALIEGDLHGRTAEVLVAVLENGLVTEVRRGENARRTLENDYVVRSLTPVLALAATPESREEKTVTLELDASWRRRQLGVAAFLQDPVSLRVHAAVGMPVPAPRR